jgi:LysR family positive regulator for ilvC
MDFSELKLFLDLSKTLHFAKTSRNCHISPSALSRTIQRLEEEIGEPLFYRDKRTVSLSDAGKRFRIFVQDTLDAWERLRNALADEQHGLRGELFLYCSVTAAYGVLADIFARFRELYPLVHIRLETGDAAAAIDKVQSGSVDITVAARPEQLPAVLLFKPVTRTDLVFIGPRVACEVTARIASGDFAWDQVPLILAEQALSRKRTEAWFREKGLKPNIYAEVGGHEAILSMVRLGCGIGVLPRLVIENSLFKDEVQVIKTEPGLKPYEVGLCVHRRRMTSQVVRAFWDIVARC